MGHCGLCRLPCRLSNASRTPHGRSVSQCFATVNKSQKHAVSSPKKIMENYDLKHSFSQIERPQKSCHIPLPFKRRYSADTLGQRPGGSVIRGIHTWPVYAFLRPVKVLLLRNMIELYHTNSTSLRRRPLAGRC